MSEWSEILEKVRDLSAPMLQDGSAPWFRGHARADWALTASIHRYVDRITTETGWNWPLDEKRGLLRDEAKSLYRRFESEAWPLLQPGEQHDWGVLFAMQHHGIPTRLLDWSESFACGVFFALHEKEREDSAAIWLLDPAVFNEASIDTRGIVAVDLDPRCRSRVRLRDWHPKFRTPKEPLAPVAIQPVYTNGRMAAQRSTFTLAGDSFQPLDEQFPQLVSSGRLAKIVISPTACQAAEEYLEQAGLSAFNFYPDLQGIAYKHVAQTERRIRFARTHFPPPDEA